MSFTAGALYYKKSSTGVFEPVTGEDGCAFSMDYRTAIGLGYFPDHIPFSVIGYNPDVDPASEDLIEWGGAYTPPTTGIQMRIRSTSANDMAGGTGVTSIDMDYLDTNYVARTITIIPNGTNPVDTVPTDILRVNVFHTQTAGTGGVAAGTITCTNVAETATYAQITAGGNMSRHGFYTIPAGKKAVIVGWNVDAGGLTSGKFTRAMLRSTSDHEGVLTPGIFQYKRMALVIDSGRALTFNIPIRIPAMADIKVTVESEANSFVSTYFEGWLEPA